MFVFVKYNRLQSCLSPLYKIGSFNKSPGYNFKPAQFTLLHSSLKIQCNIVLALSTNQKLRFVISLTSTVYILRHLIILTPFAIE
jgi:hypothetical protein